jgi:hypothetical protein
VLHIQDNSIRRTKCRFGQKASLQKSIPFSSNKNDTKKHIDLDVLNKNSQANKVKIFELNSKVMILFSRERKFFYKRRIVQKIFIYEAFLEQTMLLIKSGDNARFSIFGDFNLKLAFFLKIIVMIIYFCINRSNFSQKRQYFRPRFPRKIIALAPGGVFLESFALK